MTLCDRCKKEIKFDGIKDIIIIDSSWQTKYQLCQDCLEKFKNFIEKGE